MAINNRIREGRNSSTLYDVAWRSAGPGVLIAVMFAVAAAAAMNVEHTSASGQLRFTNRDGVLHAGWSDDLIPDADSPVRHSAQLRLPLRQLRNIDGRMTPNGESFFLLLARQMKSQSLNIVLTVDSLDRSEFAAMIAARVMDEIQLESTQIRISQRSSAAGEIDLREERMTLTITRQEFAGEERNADEPFSDDSADENDRD